MRKVVLNSSEVSVLASMTIIVLCTLALFLSGYAIQQRTLRDLRAAIRPRESRPSPKAHLPDRFRMSTTELADGTVLLVESEAAREAREVQAAMARERRRREELEQGRQERAREHSAAVEAAATPGSEQTARQRAVVERLKAQVAAKSWAVEHPDPLKAGRIPVTRAERRRMIKEEIRRLAQPEQRTYYQRRLW